MESLLAFAGYFYFTNIYQFINNNLDNCSAFIQNTQKNAEHQKSTFADKANCGNCWHKWITEKNWLTDYGTL